MRIDKEDAEAMVLEAFQGSKALTLDEVSRRTNMRRGDVSGAVARCVIAGKLRESGHVFDPAARSEQRLFSPTQEAR